MSDEAIRKIIADIDALHFDGQPCSHMEIAKPEAYFCVTANQSGHVLLARTFLEAALAPANDEQNQVVTCVHDRLTQFFDIKGDLLLGLVLRSEEIPVPDEAIAQRKRAARKQDRPILAGMIVAGFLMLTLVISGLIFWITIFLGGPAGER